MITKHKFAPKDFQSVWISGHVKDDKNKTFSAAVEYANNYHIGSISTSEGFDLKTKIVSLQNYFSFLLSFRSVLIRIKAS